MWICNSFPKEALPDDTGNVYTTAMWSANGLPELLIQDVPWCCAQIATQLLERQFRKLCTEHDLRTDDRIVVDGTYVFRAIAVTNVEYKSNLLTRCMEKWNQRHLHFDEDKLKQVPLFVFVPWFPMDMEDWATFPPAPAGRNDCRDKILKYILNPAGRCDSIRTTPYPTPRVYGKRFCTNRNFRPVPKPVSWTSSEMAYFNKYSSYFQEILEFDTIEEVLRCFPPDFQCELTKLDTHLRNHMARDHRFMTPSPGSSSSSTPSPKDPRPAFRRRAGNSTAPATPPVAAGRSPTILLPHIRRPAPPDPFQQQHRQSSENSYHRQWSRSL